MKAEKMMAKMGYKEGDGLGRNKQGMSIALQVEKTGMRSGRIIHEKNAPGSTGWILARANLISSARTQLYFSYLLLREQI